LEIARNVKSANFNPKLHAQQSHALKQTLNSWTAGGALVDDVAGSHIVTVDANMTTNQLVTPAHHSQQRGQDFLIVD
jgi:hypothetical protein